MAFVGGHADYKKYFEEDDGVLTKLNLLEIYYRSLERHGQKAASEILGTFSKFLIDFGSKDIASSMRLRLELKRKGHDVSYTDALGYHLASKMKLKFLTGDKVFKGLGNVQFKP